MTGCQGAGGRGWHRAAHDLERRSYVTLLSIGQTAVNNATVSEDASGRPFLTNVKKLRECARQKLSSGAVTTTYGGDVRKTSEILQTILATEIVCVLRYTMHPVTVVTDMAIRRQVAPATGCGRTA